MERGESLWLRQDPAPSFRGQVWGQLSPDGVPGALGQGLWGGPSSPSIMLAQGWASCSSAPMLLVLLFTCLGKDGD